MPVYSVASSAVKLSALPFPSMTILFSRSTNGSGMIRTFGVKLNGSSAATV